MTAASLVTYRGSTRWRDLAWLAWRQHRVLLISTTAFVLAVVALLALSSVVLPGNRTPLSYSWLIEALRPGQLAPLVAVYGGIVAVFWAAPLLPREYEQRTHLLVWSQDVSARRWMTGKVLTLGGVAVGLAFVLGSVGWTVLRQFDPQRGRGDGLSLFNPSFFGVAPLVQVGYVLFGMALGLLLGALLRRTVVSMAVTFVVFAATRVFVGVLLRPHYLPPVRATGPLDEPANVPADSLYVDFGYLDAAGNPVTSAEFTCFRRRPTSYESHLECMHENGIVSQYVEYQPATRLATFHVIEFALFTLLAAGLFAVTRRVIRRSGRL